MAEEGVGGEPHGLFETQPGGGQEVGAKLAVLAQGLAHVAGETQLVGKACVQPRDECQLARVEVDCLGVDEDDDEVCLGPYALRRRFEVVWVGGQGGLEDCEELAVFDAAVR